MLWNKLCRLSTILEKDVIVMSSISDDRFWSSMPVLTNSDHAFCIGELRQQVRQTLYVTHSMMIHDWYFSCFLWGDEVLISL